MEVPLRKSSRPCDKYGGRDTDRKEAKRARNAASCKSVAVAA